MPNAKVETFGACLYSLRCQRDMSQRALADIVGVSPAYISQLENERRLPPPVKVAESWARILKLSSSSGDRLIGACKRAQRSDVPISLDAKRVLAMCRRLGPRIPADALLDFEMRLRALL